MAQTRESWLDEDSQTPLINERAHQLTAFIDAMADGKIDDDELKAQEARLAAIMKEVEPQLNDALHAKVTELLCELTAYDLMQTLHGLQATRPQTIFRG